MNEALFKRSEKNAIIRKQANDLIQERLLLDPQQKDAVETTHDKVLVVAGAGSGKTRVLTERVKYLLNQGVEANGIVCITFTNLATEEMRERLSLVDRIGDVFIGTIHSFANKIFQNSDESYEIYTEEKDNEFHHYLIDKYCNDLTYRKYLTYKELIAKSELGLCSPAEARASLSAMEYGELCAIHGDEYFEELGFSTANFPETIKTLCKKFNVISFDELLLKATQYFKNLGISLEYVLVDEFQDVGNLEYSFIKSLQAKSYFFVGDDWQSIYGFKGGNVNIFLELLDSISDWVTYYINNNYRNGIKIIELSSTVISQVDKKVGKNVCCKSNKEGQVIIKSKYLLEDVLKDLADSDDFRDWFILVRTNKDIYTLGTALDKAGVPYCCFKREGMKLSEVNKLMKRNLVKLITVHSSKGLESKNVLLYGNFPVISPSYRTNDEERKVMYVGVTRASDKLIILN